MGKMFNQSKYGKKGEENTKHRKSQKFETQHEAKEMNPLIALLQNRGDRPRIQ